MIHHHRFHEGVKRSSLSELQLRILAEWPHPFLIKLSYFRDGNPLLGGQSLQHVGKLPLPVIEVGPIGRIALQRAEKVEGLEIIFADVGLGQFPFGQYSDGMVRQPRYRESKVNRSIGLRSDQLREKVAGRLRFSNKTVQETIGEIEFGFCAIGIEEQRGLEGFDGFGNVAQSLLILPARRQSAQRQVDTQSAGESRTLLASLQLCQCFSMSRGRCRR